ncbi:hypothetical protein SSS_07243 [Sarcoptes scabiei]|nr:hypothetical protein SSS_07243 [Sarcoptes scabiei]
MSDQQIEIVNHLKKKLDKGVSFEKTMHILYKLQKIPISIKLLEETGIGYKLRELSKKEKNNDVGKTAKLLILTWKELLQSQESHENQTEQWNANVNNSNDVDRNKDDNINNNVNAVDCDDERISSRKNSNSTQEKHHYHHHHPQQHRYYENIEEIADVDDDDAMDALKNSSLHRKKHKKKKSKRNRELSDNDDGEDDDQSDDHQSSAVRKERRKEKKRKHQNINSDAFGENDDDGDEDKEVMKNSKKIGYTANDHQNKSICKTKNGDVDAIQMHPKLDRKSFDTISRNSVVPSNRSKSDVPKITASHTPSSTSSNRLVSSSNDMFSAILNSADHTANQSRIAKNRSIQSKTPSSSSSTKLMPENPFEREIIQSLSSRYDPYIYNDVSDYNHHNQSNRASVEEKNLMKMAGMKFKGRTQVYAGSSKVINVSKVFRLQDICIKVLMNHVDKIYEVGDLPYFILKPVFSKCSVQQLRRIEAYNPQLIEDTDELWRDFCEKEFKNKRLNDSEFDSWRDLYNHLIEEREEKLKKITNNINSKQRKAIPA